MDATDASESGNLWYPLECIVVSRRGGCFYAGHRVSAFDVRHNCFKRLILEGVSGDVGFPHMSVGLRIENTW